MLIPELYLPVHSLLAAQYVETQSRRQEKGTDKGTQKGAGEKLNM